MLCVYVMRCVFLMLFVLCQVDGYVAVVVDYVVIVGGWVVYTSIVFVESCDMIVIVHVMHAVVVSGVSVVNVVMYDSVLIVFIMWFVHMR